jgi:predicted RNA-binding protein YlqC (UPF0109 family)
VDGPLPVDGAATIIRAERVAAPTHEVLGAPKPYVPRERRDPDDTDHKLRDLVVHMAKGIVDHPDDVQVDVLEAGEDASFELSVNGRDLGHVIGKQGRTARSLRLALGAAAAKAGRSASAARNSRGGHARLRGSDCERSPRGEELHVARPPGRDA